MVARLPLPRFWECALGAGHGPGIPECFGQGGKDDLEFWHPLSLGLGIRGPGNTWASLGHPHLIPGHPMQAHIEGKL